MKFLNISKWNISSCISRHETATDTAWKSSPVYMPFFWDALKLSFYPVIFLNR